jgi:preprotein translocase SecE subunit
MNSKFMKYFRGVGEEARRVRWPDQKTLWKNVGIVLLISIGFALFIYACDALTIQIMKSFKNAFGTSTSGSTPPVLLLIWSVSS